MSWKAISVEYNGVQYRSMNQLYKTLQSRIRRHGHRELEMNYADFINMYKTSGDIDYAVQIAINYRRREIKDLKRSSRTLKGADNLVCQRMTKLGWSYEKAVSTPKCTKHLPIKVKIKGKTYRSIAAAQRAVMPDSNPCSFAAILRKKGLIK